MADKRLDQTTNASAVAAADNIPFVTAAGVTSYVTGDEMAASGPFSSRYAPRADQKITLFAGMLTPLFGAATLSYLSVSGNGLGTAWLLDSGGAEATEGVGATLFVPDWWATFNIDVVWANAAASSGDVVWGSWGRFAGDGVVADSALAFSFDSGNITTTAPSTKGEVEISRLVTSASNTSTSPLFLVVRRLGSNVADTLANDCALYAVVLTRAS